MTRIKTFSFLIIFCAMLPPVLHGQIPNAGFENWTGGMPDGYCTWGSDSMVTEIPGYAGSAARLEEREFAYYEFFPCIDGSPAPFPMSENYNAIRFYYKCNIMPDSLYSQHAMEFYFNIYDASMGIKAHAYYRFDHSENTNDWTEMILPFFQYPNSEPPAWGNLTVAVQGASPGGSWWAIDEMELIEWVGIEEPQPGELWMAGEADTIRWSGGERSQAFRLEYSDNDGLSYNLIDVVAPADTGMCVWDVPDTLLSTRMSIRIKDDATSEVLTESDHFRVKPYLITRLNQNDDYVPYDIDLDRWGFGNYESDIWPYSWWFNNFNYQGIDPFTHLPYPAYGAFAGAFRFEFPDWVSFVNTFTVDACYWNVSRGYYSPRAVLYWWALKKYPWRGSCFGLAISNALAFAERDPFVTRYPDFPNFDDPVNVSSDNDVIPVINELFTHQFGEPHRSIIADKKDTKTPNETLNELKEILREDNVSIKALNIYNNYGPGGHTVLPYKVERDLSDDDRYVISVWDNSFHDKLDATVQIDTAWNSDQGLWYTSYGWNGWGGFEGIILTDETVSYLSNPAIPAPGGGRTAMAFSDSTIEINATIDVSISITDSLGNRTGYADSVITDEIPGSHPLILLNGSETPPYGYLLRTGDYSIVLEDFVGDTIDLFLFSGNKSYSFERSGALEDQSDRFTFGNRLSVTNPDPEIKSVTLRSIVSEVDHEKLFLLEALDIAQDDSVAIENVDDDENLKLINDGSEKEYGIGLEYASESRSELFGHSNVPLPVNTAHTLAPAWGDLAASDLIVLVDVGNDGTVDDTLVLENETVIIEGDGQESLLVPKEYRLGQNYPNPFNPSTTIMFDVPGTPGEQQAVNLVIYDLRGRRVRTLIDTAIEPGSHKIHWNGRDHRGNAVPSGIYLYTLRAGEKRFTRKMTILK